MKFGLVSVNIARQVNAAHSKTTVNAARPMTYLSKTTHSTVKRPIHKKTTFKNSNVNPKVNIVGGKNVNTVRPKAVVNAGNPQMDLQDKGVIDSGCSRLVVYKFEGNALAWWKAYKQAKGSDAWLINVTWADFKKLFFFIVFFPRAEQEPTGTEEEQAKNFQWGLRRSTLNHLMCMSYTDVAQVANAARNYEILHESDDDDIERPDKRKKSGDRHQPTSQQSSHRNHDHNNDHHGSDRRSGGDNYRSNNNYSGRIPVMGVTRETGVSSPTDLPFLTFKTLCLLNYALMICHDYDITSSLRRGALHLQTVKR
nr:hypothetical protein [Tanacetum cinerariifolium]